ncbi:unnamed protein product, partial [Brenthis ino]
MTEAQVGLLIKAASILSQNENDDTSQILKSYYLTRCKLITKGFGLPKKQFSDQVRCSRCCIEWNIETKVKIRTCSFCGRNTKSLLPKPNNSKINLITEEKNISNSNNVKIQKKQTVKKNNNSINQEFQSNVYCESKLAFSLNLKKNTIHTSIKQKPKIIKNNKKKKDKFAGLCQKAVVAATQLKQVKENKLNLFLKPSIS